MLRACIIIEDQPPAQRILQKYIQDIGSLELKATFNNAIDAIPYLQSNSVDIIFLDIHLPKISGMDFLKTLKKSPQIILTTAFSDYAIESYEYNVVDYLLKPFSFQRFVQAVSKSAGLSNKAKQINDNKKQVLDEVFFIKSGYELFKVNASNIIYIKSDSDYTEIVTSQKTYLSSDALKKWLQKLDNTFCQIHKSHIINITYLEKVSANQVYLKNDYVVPIGRAFKEEFIKNYLKEK